jgi:type I restriction enzyme M protein
MPDHHYYSNFIWDIADLLRGPYRPPQYERVMLPMTVLRRFDCVLAETKEKVLAQYQARKDNLKDEALDAYLNKAAGQKFHNRSPLDFEKLKGDPDNIDKHLVSYIKGFSKNIQVIFDRFDFGIEIEKMREANILYLVVSKFCDVDLHPDKVDNIQMGLIFEDLIRRFNEQANETAGDYFTPREVIRLMVDILFDPDDEILTQPGIVRKLLDPACGTGGMLSEAQNHLRAHNQKADLWTFGQDFNPRAYAIAASDMLMKGNGNSDIRFGDSFTDDKYPHDDPTTGGRFDYFLANPPFGVDWKRQKSAIERERDKLGFAGRFGAGLPRVNDGSLLFLQHMISKFEPYDPARMKYGSRLGIVFNGSPLFTGGAGSGESEIRKWVIENDWLEAIIALPEQMFYNTGIGTYVWIVTNRKDEHRKGKIQLIDARSDRFYVPMRRSLGDKRRRIGGTEDGDPDQIGEIVRLYGDFRENEFSKIFDNEDFGYNRVIIERPVRLCYQMDLERKSRFLDAVPHLLDDVQAIDRKVGREPRLDWNEVNESIDELLKERGSKWKAAEKKLFREVFTERNAGAAPVILKERKPTREENARVWGWFFDPRSKTERMFEPDPQLRDSENIRLKEDIAAYFLREVEPHAPDAWADSEKITTAYEINFNRYFYTYAPPRPLAEIDADIKNMEAEIVRLLREVTS